jgi:hypothetical protein
VGLNYSRDRVVECYLWSYTAYYEQEYTRARIILAKIIAIIIMTDDTYDVRASLMECRQLNEAIQRLVILDVALSSQFRNETCMHITSFRGSTK